MHPRTEYLTLKFKISDDTEHALKTAVVGNHSCFIPQLEPFPQETLQQKPNANAVRSLEAVIRVQSKWGGSPSPIPPLSHFFSWEWVLLTFCYKCRLTS